jgi:hypothetical protein
MSVTILADARTSHVSQGVTMTNREQDTENAAKGLLTMAAAYGRHSGPGSDERERATFGADVLKQALRYARAYYAEARELGLIPEYERAGSSPGVAELRGLQLLRRHLDEGGHDWREGDNRADVEKACAWLDRKVSL